jgi:hypothetical protein
MESRMRKVMVSPCHPDYIFTMCDPDLPTEAEFEAITLRAFGCVYPQYRCILFGGRFLYEGDYRKPDLAMVARDRSHWFVIEVELVSHSLEGHVLPQVQAFRYGEPQNECAGLLSRELGIDLGEAATLINCVPRAVVVVTNRARSDWENMIRAHQGQLLTITRFQGPTGREAFEVSGSLAAVKESLGFGTYSAQDGMIRFASSIKLPDGHIQLEMTSGVASLWRVLRDERFTWVIKDTGRIDVADGAHIQLIRAIDGRITLRL